MSANQIPTVLVVSQKDSASDLPWETLFSRDPDLSVKLVHAEANTILPILLRQTAIDAVVFDCQTMDEEEVKILSKISALKPACGIVALAEQIAIFSYQQAARLKNMVTIQKPFEHEMLLSVLRKVLQQEEFRPQICTRFITDESVRILAKKTGLLISTRMRNYSASGAFLEYRGISLDVGDQIQMNLIKSRDANRKEILRVNGKVVWIRNGEHSTSPTRGIGVQFVQD